MRAVGIILAGGNSNKMRELTHKRAVAAMPIAGSYRAIDFALSNMSNSHIQKVAVLTQYNARSLNEHLNSSKWWDFGRKQGGLYVFTPTITAENGYWYRGTADAIYQNLDFLKRCHEPYVIITSGDAVYKMDYNKVLEYHIDKNRIITMGFSAGGHLAASYGDFWKNHEFLAKELGVDAELLRPNGQILGYQVISSGPKAHRDSFTSLLGEHYDELVDAMSLENQVNEDVPPTFLWHTETDDLVPVENSILFFNALHEHHIPVEMHIYPIGGHGISLATEETRYRDGGGIFPQCQNWIEMAVRGAKEIG